VHLFPGYGDAEKKVGPGGTSVGDSSAKTDEAIEIHVNTEKQQHGFSRLGLCVLILCDTENEQYAKLKLAQSSLCIDDDGHRMEMYHQLEVSGCLSGCIIVCS
jgi:hypothetical protein